MHRFLGYVAAINQWSRRQDIHGVTIHLWLMVFLPIVMMFGWVLGVGEPSWIAVVVAVVSTAIYLLILQSTLRHDVVFERDHPNLERPHSEGRGPADPPGFQASGRFLLRKADRPPWLRFLHVLMTGSRGDRWFVGVPASLVIHDEDHFSIATSLDASDRFLGVSLGDQAGLWTIDGQFANLARPELGRLHYGAAMQPSMRLRFWTTRGKRRDVVLTFDDEPTRNRFVAALRTAAGPNWPGLY